VCPRERLQLNVGDYLSMLLVETEGSRLLWRLSRLCVSDLSTPVVRTRASSVIGCSTELDAAMGADGYFPLRVFVCLNDHLRRSRIVGADTE